MKFWIGMALAACAGVAIAAGGRGEVRKQAEASMLVTGTIDIEADGRVGDFRLDGAEKLPKGAVGLIGKAAPTWKFEPVVIDGKAVKARTKMSLRIVARQQSEDRLELRIASANFGAGNHRPGEFLTKKDLRPPRYPASAAMNGVKGSVYLVLRVGRDGTVEDVVAEQVNLKVIDNEGGMMRWRDTLANASIAQARKWTFNPPTEGEERDKPFWLLRIPVDFMMGDEQPAYGQWEGYVPGPRQSTPWLGAMDAALGADAVAGGDIYPIGSGPKLLTPLDGA